MKPILQKGCAALLGAALVLSLSPVHARAAQAVKKDETVYVFASADGSIKKCTVSDWLENTGKAASIQDSSRLTGIENIKGDETFTQGKGHALVWNAGGSDIYYQGSTSEKPPVNVRITYQLDGAPITAQKLAGQSGHVTIRFDYENALTKTVTVKNKQVQMCVPFAAVTAILLPTDHFRNVTVTNGKLENLGNEIAVLGIALPGMQASLDLKSEDLEIPQYVELSADVTDFSLEGTVTLVSNTFLDDLNTKDLNVADLLDASRQLTSGTGQLIDGAGKLSKGLATLLDKSSELVKGIDQLKEGSMQLKTGADTLSGGAAQLQTGAAQLSQGLSTLSANSESLRSGAQQVFQSLLSSASAQLAEKGVQVSLSIDNYGSVLGGLIDQLTSGAHDEALRKVTAAVEEKRPDIQAKVSAAVTQQVQAQVTEAATQVARETVAQAVQANQDTFLAQVLTQHLGMTPEEYAAAIENGTVTPEQQQAVEDAVAAAMESAIGQQMQSPEVQERITAAVETNMASSDVQATIAQLTKEQTDLKIQEAISAAMASEEVQGELNAAAKNAEAITALKASLDSYNSFYVGVISYTKGADQATAGANDLKKGADTLKTGMDTLDSGIGTLNEGIQRMQEQSPALVDGVAQLSDGSVRLKEGLDKLMRDGIRKIADLAEEDLDTLVERLRTSADLAQTYANFSGISDGMEGSVKFIYRTDAIKNPA